MFCILIPTINRKDLLMDALDWYLTNLPNTEIIVLDNGKQGIVSGNDRLRVFESQRNLGVATSWNWLIRRALNKKYTHFLILNDDVILKRSEYEINAIILKHGENSFIRPHPIYNWSAYILSADIYDKVGKFDESFEKCFFEDNDYEYRMKLAGINIKYEEGLNAHVYLNSQSTLKDPSLGDYVANREYYINKWGGEPSKETYQTPFNK